jgi:Asp-tRNA(Asn)/Glu-tRNA(Gln) amidotransferase A subunit family amidase
MSGMRMLKEILEKISDNNKIYKHYSFIPNEEEFLNFHSSNEDFFYNSRNIKKEPGFKFTVKDIFNTYVYPTSMGSTLWNNFKSGNNARVITDALWKNGGCFAKTVTSEFAVHEETDVINPWNSDFSVGTSSAGSSVSVLVDEIDFSLATQTAGSIGRPASYTGTFAFKPSYGLIPRTGVLKTCDPFDTIGFFIKDSSKISEIFQNLVKVGFDHPNNILIKSINKKKEKKIAFINNPKIKYDNIITNKFLSFIKELKFLNYKFEEYNLPHELSSIHENHEMIYSYSLLYYFSKELKSTKDVSESFLNTINIGKLIKPSHFVKLLEKHQDDIFLFENWMDKNNIDLIMSPSTASVAYKKDEKYIDKPDLNLLYTYLHLPIAYIPLWFDKNLNLPFGLAITTKRYNDLFLIDQFKFISSLFKQNEGNKYND